MSLFYVIIQDEQTVSISRSTWLSKFGAFYSWLNSCTVFISFITKKKLITKRVYYGQVRQLLSKEMASPLHGHCLKSEQSIKQSIVGFGRPKQDANNAHDSSTSWNSVVTCTHWHMYAGTYIISTLSAVRPKVYLHVPAVALKTNFGVRNSEFTRITFA